MELSIAEVSDLLEISRAAVYQAVKRGRLTSFIGSDGFSKVAYSDVSHYVDSKYNRTESRVNGMLIFDKKQGYYSIKECAALLGIKKQRVYFLIRAGKIKADRRGVQFVVSMSVIRAYLEKHQPTFVVKQQAG